MIKWIFWIIIIWWLLSKVKFVFNTENDTINKRPDKNPNQFKSTNNQNKKLKQDAGDYVDYEEVN
ncbi:MAG: hypothetical protein N2203_07075 [Bacteroidia bacterium]|nr:hypothetical protein [Bacteroidia bacterium]